MTAEQYPKIYLYKRIVQAKLFIDNNYAEDIDLDNIADEAYFSKFHFIRLFKNIFGSTPHHYLRQVRIENAKQLLAKNISASQVCFLVGFDSVSSFTVFLKKLQVSLRLHTNCCNTSAGLLSPPILYILCRPAMHTKRAGYKIAILKKCDYNALQTFVYH
jgi:AraC-like DNA-binding protein